MSSDEFTPKLITYSADNPPKTNERYETAYDRFMKWKKEKNLKTLSEDTFLQYFQEQSQTLKSSGLFYNYVKLRNIVNIKHGIELKTYQKLNAYLKGKSGQRKPKKFQILKAEEYRKFLLEAPDDVYLLIKAVVIIGSAGNCIIRELVHLSKFDIQDTDGAMLITIRGTEIDQSRTFSLTGDFYQICKKYANLPRPSGSPDRFFLKYSNGECFPQGVGFRKFGSMVKEVATYLKLPNPHRYCLHFFGRSSDSLNHNLGGNPHKVFISNETQSKNNDKRICQSSRIESSNDNTLVILQRKISNLIERVAILENQNEKLLQQNEEILKGVKQLSEFKSRVNETLNKELNTSEVKIEVEIEEVNLKMQFSEHV